jgi:AcrR family transcriptional regulator
VRADAQRNLDRLLEAAGECFAADGLDVSIDEIARRAGVGHGTVFRHFPTKDALVEAVLAKELTRLAEVAGEALEDPDPGAGFERFFRAVAAGYARSRALVEGIELCRELPAKVALERSAKRLVREAQKAGTLRSDLSADEIFELVPAASRFPDVILDGLRPQPQPVVV